MNRYENINLTDKYKKGKYKVAFLHCMVQIAVMFPAMLAGEACHVTSDHIRDHA